MPQEERGGTREGEGKGRGWRGSEEEERRRRNGKGEWKRRGLGAVQTKVHMEITGEGGTCRLKHTQSNAM